MTIDFSFDEITFSTYKLLNREHIAGEQEGRRYSYDLRRGPMNTIREEVRELISVNERIQSALVQGHQWTEDEKNLIEICAGQLLTYVGEGELSPRLKDRSRESGDGAQFIKPGNGSWGITAK